MGNEKQIDIDLLEQSKSAFLPQEFQDPDAIDTIYSLEDEYAKTRKNRNWILYLSVVTFLVLVVGGSLIYTGWLQSEGKQITIDISDFEDVRLLELVNESKDIENEIEKLEYELKDEESQYKEQVELFSDEHRSQRDAIQAMDISETEKQAQLSDIYSRYRRQVQNAEQRYESRVSDINSEIRKLETKLADLNDQIGAKGQIARTALGNKDELHNLQQKRLQNYYEDRIEKLNTDHQLEINSLIYKFNPVFQEPPLRTIIQQPVRTYELPESLLMDVEDILQGEAAATSLEIQNIRKRTSDQYMLLNRLQRIPYQNSIPRTLLHSESLSKYSIKTYDEIVLRLAEQIRKKNRIISQYDYALSAKLRNDGENGFVLDNRNPQRIPAYIDPIYSPEDGTRVFIFRNSEEIASGRIFKQDTSYYIEPDNTATAANIQPLDNIMLRVTQE